MEKTGQVTMASVSIARKRRSKKKRKSTDSANDKVVRRKDRGLGIVDFLCEFDSSGVHLVKLIAGNGNQTTLNEKVGKRF